MGIKRSNRTPWTDILTLIAATETKDDDGYTTKTETSREVFATITEGVTRSEYYEAYKAGVKLSATAEIWQDDYDGETICEHNSKRYNIIRTFEMGTGTLQLSLEEVTR